MPSKRTEMENEAMRRISMAVIRACDREHRILLGRHMCDAVLIAAGTTIASLAPAGSTKADFEELAEAGSRVLTSWIMQGAKTRLHP